LINYPEQFRVAGDRNYPGAFNVAYQNRGLLCISSNLMGWEHVSVSLKNRCPNWNEMCFIKQLFWDEYSWVMQLHPPKEKNIDIFSTCLHLWAPINGEKIPLPPEIMV
jgi:hypothetical protein